MSIVDIKQVTAPKVIAITTHSGENILGYRGQLFREPEGEDATMVNEWSSAELEAGVSFVFDAGAAGFVFRLVLQISADASIVVDITYTPAPPAPGHYDVPLPIADGNLQERDWVFAKEGGA
jgi:hypothetical protein